MCQEKLKAKATETTFPSVQRRGRKEPGHMIEADGVKSTAVRENRDSQPPFASIFSFKEWKRWKAS